MSVLIGYEIMTTEHRMLNIFIMYAKKYIYNCKMNVRAPCITEFRKYLKSCVDVLMHLDCKYKNEYALIAEF